MAILGVDVGGTFTDAVLLADGTLSTAKVPTRPAQEESVVEAARLVLDAAEAPGVERFAHGTTVATNALLERKGARTAFVATEGFEHLLHLRRQNRAHLYRLDVDHPEPLVPLERCVGVRERIGPDGHREAACAGDPPRGGRGGDRGLPPLRLPRPVARACGRGRAAPTTTGRARRRLARDLARAARVRARLDHRRRRLPRPCGARYLRALGTAARDAALPEPFVMRSSGGVATIDEAAAHPALILVSGPAAGVVAAERIAALAGVDDAIAFDMGGTSTDVCLIAGGRAGRADERTVAGFPLRVPMVDVHTVGAGGGSIARRDAGGALRVGPESAGASPGPACYGRGGIEPTVTDANLLLGAASRAPSRGPRARSRRGAEGDGRHRPGRRGGRRQRRDAPRAPRRLGRAGARPAPVRARRIRRRGAAPRLRARGGARRDACARPRDRRGALRGRARRERRAP